MDGRQRDGGLVLVGGDARQRFHDARGYGRPREGNEILLAPVEAAHLLSRGDLDAVTVDGDRRDFPAYVAGQPPDFLARFVVYRDLRDRGFYLSPARPDWVEDAAGVAFVVHPRGTGPGDGEVAHRVRVVGERDAVPAASLGDVVLAVVDEESEITYLDTRPADLDAREHDHPPAATGRLHGDRVVVWNPPDALHRSAFYGHPLGGRNADGPLQLSLVEAAYLAAEGVLGVDHERPVRALLERGRTVEGDRFDRRLRAYRLLRDRGLTPKTGFKFGADFRVYPDVESVEDLGHSTHLVRVIPPGHEFDPRALALDVRLAAGVRKQLVFACTHEDRDDVDWLAVARLTP